MHIFINRSRLCPMHAQGHQGYADAGRAPTQAPQKPQQPLSSARSSEASTLSAAIAAVSASEDRQHVMPAVCTHERQSPLGGAGSLTSSFTSCSGGSAGARSITAVSDSQ